jgi:hypothetical protein
VADFQVLATKLDGILMVVQPGNTRADAAIAMLEQLERVDGSILGVVLNKIPRDSLHYGGYYHYYHQNKRGEYYYQPGEENQPQLEANNQVIKFLPQAESQPVEYFITENYEKPEGFDNVFQPRTPVEVYTPPKDIPATLDIITKPRKRKETIYMAETPSYVIQKHYLEYWYDNGENETNEG